MMDRQTKRFAFTLAEVLITLGIIGVVAAMTIPTLVANYQKAQYVTQLKKAYTQFNQALVQYAADSGCPGDLACIGDWGYQNNNAASTGKVGPELVKYFKVIKDCAGQDNLGCMPSSANKKFDGSGSIVTTLDTGWRYKFITADGASFGFASNGNNCGSNGSNGKFGYLSQWCGDLVIDVNGPSKGPNYFGRDLYTGIIITNGKGPLLYPMTGADHAWWHWNDSGSPGACDQSSTTSEYCASRILEKNWTMDY